jgi:hypothetical protein
VALNWADLAAMALLVAAGWAVSYTVMRRVLRRAVAERQLEAESQLSALASAVKTLQTRVAELGERREPQATVVTELDLGPATETTDEAVELEDGEITAEIMAVIAAAATAFLGKKVRILSAKLLESPQEVVNAWSQQGRVFVQASHNLRSRG